MDIEKIFSGVFAILLGLGSVIGRKTHAYNAFMRNYFKPTYDEKRIKIAEIMFLIFGIIFILFGILHLIFG